MNFKIQTEKHPNESLLSFKLIAIYIVILFGAVCAAPDLILGVAKNMTEHTYDGYPAYLVCKIDLIRDSPAEDSLNVSTSMVSQEKVIFPTLKEYRLFTIGNYIV